METKGSRKKQKLLEKLAPDGELNRDVYDALIRVVKEYRDPYPSDESLANFDKVIERFVKARIELDRIQRQERKRQ